MPGVACQPPVDLNLEPLMTIDWIAFTPEHALIGGALIGLGSAIYILGSGRVAGIAGIVASPLRALMTGASLRPEASRLLFIAGLMLAPWLWQMLAPLPQTSVDVGLPGLILAGLLVGFGVRLGNGCTSGHGVSGLSRFSARSLVNVLAFMGAGVVAVFAMRHLF